MKCKYLYVFAFVLLAVFPLSACSKNKVQNLDDFEQLLIQSDTQEEKEPFAELIYIIIPDTCSGEISMRAEKLARELNEKTSIRTVVRYDSQPVMSGDEILEILIGNTSRIISQESLKTLRDTDYVCRYEQGSILIGGKSERATMMALDIFERDILPGVSYAAIMSSYAHFESFGEYSVDSLSLNGFFIYDYTIVYKGGEFEKEFATLLRDYISIKSGYTLKLCPYDALNDFAAKTILICSDDTLTDGMSMLICNDNNVEIRGADEYTLSAAVARFAQILLPEGVGGEYDASLDERTIVECNQEHLELAISFAEYKDKPDPDFLVDLTNNVRSFRGDLLCFFELSGDLNDDIEFNCVDGMEFYISERESLPLVHKDSVDPEDVCFQNGLLRMNICLDGGETWNLYMLEDNSFAKIENEIGDKSIVISKEKIDSDKLTLVKEISYGFEEELKVCFVYVSCSLASETRIYSQIKESSYMTFCAVELEPKYHEDFQTLKNAVE